MPSSSRLVTVLSASTAAAVVGLIAHAQNLTVKGANTTEGNAYFYQNVGIGTTAAGARLVVDDGAQPEWRGKLTFGGSVMGLQEQNGSRSTYPYIQWTNAAGIRGAYLGWGSSVSPKRLDLMLENGHNLYIGGGRVGIGTATPADMLSFYVPSYPQAIRFSNSGGNDLQLLYTYGAGGYRFSTAWSGVEVLTVHQTGNVGIGTSNPTQKLEVMGGGGIKIGQSPTLKRGRIVVSDSCYGCVQIAVQAGNYLCFCGGDS